MQRVECAFAKRGIASGFYIRGNLSPAHDHQRTQPGHGLVFNARLGMAETQNGVRTLAGSIELRRKRTAKNFTFDAASRRLRFDGRYLHATHRVSGWARSAVPLNRPCA